MTHRQPRVAGAVRLPLRIAAVLTALHILSGCQPADAASRSVRTPDGPVTGTPVAGVVDSIIPIPEALARFQSDLPAVDTLSGGAPSREALVARFMAALELRDTTAVRALVIDRAEFAYIYYPTSEYVAPPRAQAPSLAWFLIQQNSEKGITRSLRRLGGLPLRADSLNCASARAEGDNSLWSDCTIALRVDGEGTAERQRLFGSIIERGGRFKFVSYANQF